MKHKVFNSTLDKGYLSFPNLTIQEERMIEAELFEQIMLFDRIYLKTGRVNFALVFLIKKFGLKMVERLIEIDYIQFLLYTPMIVNGVGRRREDGTIDESTVLGQPPIVSGSLETEKNFKEKLIDETLSLYDLPRRKKKPLKRKIMKNTILPDGLKSSQTAVEIVVDAYKGNLLDSVGLPYEKEPNQLPVDGRTELKNLSNNVLETILLSKYGLKSFNQFDNQKLYNQNLENIGNALNVTNNAVEIFDMENIPNLKQLFLEEKLTFEQALKLRHGSSAKYFRNWLNTISESNDSIKISEEYINEIVGKKGFFQSKGGKFVKTTGMYGLGKALAAFIVNPLLSISATLGLRMFDTFILQHLIKGKSAKMFVDRVKAEVKE